MSATFTWFVQLFGFSTYEGIIILILPFAFDFLPTLIKNLGIIILHYWRIISYKFHLGKLKNKKALIGVSIIIAAHNEEKNIANTLDNIINQNYPKLDIIVIDDGSTDKTYYACQTYAKKGLIKLFRRNNRQGGSKSTALNKGITLAKNEVVVTIDADTELDRNAIRELTKLFYDNYIVAIAGNVGVKNKSNLLTKLQAYEYFTSFDLGRRWMDLLHGIIVIPGAVGAYRRDFLRSLGGFDSDTITEDFDTALKFHKVKGRVIFSPKAYAWTIVPTTIKNWIRQRTRWARGELECFAKHNNIIFRPIYGTAGLFGAPVMIFKDVILLLIRILYVYFVFVIFPFMQNIPLEKLVWFFTRTIIMTFVIYTIIELLSVITALIITPHRKDIKYFLYFPIIIFIYRPFHAFIRLRGYLEHLMHKLPQW